MKFKLLFLLTLFVRFSFATNNDNLYNSSNNMRCATLESATYNLQLVSATPQNQKSDIMNCLNGDTNYKNHHWLQSGICSETNGIGTYKLDSFYENKSCYTFDQDGSKYQLQYFANESTLSIALERLSYNVESRQYNICMGSNNRLISQYNKSMEIYNNQLSQYNQTNRIYQSQLISYDSKYSKAKKIRDGLVAQAYEICMNGGLKTKGYPVPLIACHAYAEVYTITNLEPYYNYKRG